MSPELSTEQVGGFAVFFHPSQPWDKETVTPRWTRHTPAFPIDPKHSRSDSIIAATQPSQVHKDETKSVQGFAKFANTCFAIQEEILPNFHLHDVERNYAELPMINRIGRAQSLEESALLPDTGLTLHTCANLMNEMYGGFDTGGKKADVLR